MPKFKVTRTKGVELFQALGCFVADTWPLAKLEDRLNALPRIIAEDQMTGNKELDVFLDELIAKIEEGTHIVVADTDDVVVDDELKEEQQTLTKEGENDLASCNDQGGDGGGDDDDEEEEEYPDGNDDDWNEDDAGDDGEEDCDDESRNEDETMPVKRAKTRKGRKTKAGVKRPRLVTKQKPVKPQKPKRDHKEEPKHSEPECPEPKHSEPQHPMSLMSAALHVLKAAGSPLRCKDIIERCQAEGLWKSPVGATPAQTLRTLFVREFIQKHRPPLVKLFDRGLYGLPEWIRSDDSSSEDVSGNASEQAKQPRGRPKRATAVS